MGNNPDIQYWNRYFCLEWEVEVIGNQAVGLYSYFPTVNLGFDYAFNNTIAPGAAITSSVDPEISWETTRTYNIGTDISAWNLI